MEVAEPPHVPVVEQSPEPAAQPVVQPENVLMEVAEPPYVPVVDQPPEPAAQHVHTPARANNASNTNEQYYYDSLWLYIAKDGPTKSDDSTTNFVSYLVFEIQKLMLTLVQ